MLGRGRLFQRPGDSDEEDEGGRVVQMGKPINQAMAKKLDQIGVNYNPRTFVSGSAKTQADFYGVQHVNQCEPGGSGSVSEASAGLTTDQRNKLNAKIMKAQLTGNKELEQKLKKKLEGGGKAEPDESQELNNGPKDVLLTRTHFRTGMTLPAHTKSRASEQASSSVAELVREEKTTSSEDQLAMCGALDQAAIDRDAQDDYAVGDASIEKKSKKRKKGDRDHGEKQEKRRRDHAIKDYKRQQETLDSCKLCLDSARRAKHLVVAVGLKTYLCMPPTQPLTPGHCWIVPMAHYCSAAQLDEDVYHEMMIWRRGLVALFADRDQDCIFLETAKNIRHQPHMFIECIPFDNEHSDMVAVFFKKAILESEEDDSQNKKLIELNKKDIRHSIPRGFSYVAVDFGAQAGYAHLIETEANFEHTFGHQILGGMLDLDMTVVRKPKSLSKDEQMKNVAEMKLAWKAYDWTDRAKQAIADNSD